MLNTQQIHKHAESTFSQVALRELWADGGEVSVPGLFWVCCVVALLAAVALVCCRMEWTELLKLFRRPSYLNPQIVSRRTNDRRDWERRKRNETRVGDETTTINNTTPTQQLPAEPKFLIFTNPAKYHSPVFDNRWRKSSQVQECVRIHTTSHRRFF